MWQSERRFQGRRPLAFRVRRALGAGGKIEMLGGYALVLIAAEPGWLREALRAMLVSMPYVIILEAGDVPAVKRSLHRYHPDLVMVDGDLPGNDGIEVVRSVQFHRPATRSLLLANSISQQAAALQAGADRSPLKGEPAVRMFAQVEQLLGRPRLRPAAN